MAAGTPLAEMASCAFMGTVVRSGSGDAIVVSTGRSTRFGEIAAGLGEHQPRADFQRGLGRFSALSAKVGGVLSVAILIINLVLGRPLIDAVLFSLAIAVGITPQLLPAMVSMSLATGSRRLAERKVLVKRLVCIEDLGDVDVLFTDKTGTLIEGHIRFDRAINPLDEPDDEILTLGLVCNEATVTEGVAVGGNSLDTALWETPATSSVSIGDFRRIALAPFDHDRRCVSVLVDRDEKRMIITKGAPEAILERCTSVSDAARAVLDTEFSAGLRVLPWPPERRPGRVRCTHRTNTIWNSAGFSSSSISPRSPPPLR